MDILIILKKSPKLSFGLFRSLIGSIELERRFGGKRPTEKSMS